MRMVHPGRFFLVGSVSSKYNLVNNSCIVYSQKRVSFALGSCNWKAQKNHQHLKGRKTLKLDCIRSISKKLTVCDTQHAHWI